MPWVVGPSQIPFINQKSEIRANLDLAVLSAILHTDEIQTEHMVEFLRAIHEVDDGPTLHYSDVLSAVLRPVVASALEEMMQQGKSPFISDFANKYYGKGRSEGVAVGEAKGKAEGILLVLRTRGFTVDENALRDQLAQMDDPTSLDEIMALAVRVSEYQEFADRVESLLAEKK